MAIPAITDSKAPCLEADFFMSHHSDISRYEMQCGYGDVVHMKSLRVPPTGFKMVTFRLN